MEVTPGLKEAVTSVGTFKTTKPDPPAPAPDKMCVLGAELL